MPMCGQQSAHARGAHDFIHRAPELFGRQHRMAGVANAGDQRAEAAVPELNDRTAP